MADAPDWNVTRLGDFAKLHKGVSYKGDYLDEPGPFLLGLGTIVPGGGLKMNEARSYAGPIKDHQYIDPGEMLIALTDITQDGRVLGSPGRLPVSAKSRFAVTHHVARVEILRRHIVDVRYLYYAFQSPEARGFVRGRATGTTVRAVSPRDVESYEIPLPPLPEQRAIAEVLGALDDKIDANLKLASRLYEFAITFGIHACERAAGRYLPLGEIVQITKGVSYRSEDLIPGLGFLVGLKCAARDGSFRYDGLKSYSGPSKESQVVGTGDILVAQTDLTQRAEVIGRPIRVPALSGEGVIVASLDFAILRPGSSVTTEVLLAILSTQQFRDHALSFCNGTTVLHMSGKAVPSYECFLPAIKDVARVTEIMAPNLRGSDAARNESEALAALRDTLLPKLLSGELRVRDAEELVGVAV